MSCASCANSIERALLNVPGVVEGNVNFSSDSPQERLCQRASVRRYFTTQGLSAAVYYEATAMIITSPDPKISR